MKISDIVINDYKNIYYSQYIKIIRNYINQEFVSASYIQEYDNDISEFISKEEIFPKVYREMYGGIPFKKYRHLENIIRDGNKLRYIYIILQKKNGVNEVYIKELASKRKDINMDYLNRDKIPESIIIDHSKNKDIEKLSELRLYIDNNRKVDLNKYLKNVEKALSNKSVQISSLPTILFIPLILDNNKYFSNILYMSNQYYQSYSYSFDLKDSSFAGMKTKKPIRVPKNYFSALIISEIDKNPTLEPFILNLPYEFEFDIDNLNKLEIEVNLDEARNRFYNSLDSIINSIVSLSFKPDDFGSYQLTIDKNYNMKIIDFSSGIEIPTNIKGLKKLVIEAIIDIYEKMSNSSLLSKCIIKDKKLYCNKDINKKMDLKNLLDISIQIMDIKSIRERRLKDLIDEISFPKIKEYMEIVDSKVDKEKIETIREYATKILNSYNNEYSN